MVIMAKLVSFSKSNIRTTFKLAIMMCLISAFILFFTDSYLLGVLAFPLTLCIVFLLKVMLLFICFFDK